MLCSWLTSLHIDDKFRNPHVLNHEAGGKPSFIHGMQPYVFIEAFSYFKKCHNHLILGCHNSDCMLVNI